MIRALYSKLLKSRGKPVSALLLLIILCCTNNTINNTNAKLEPGNHTYTYNYNGVQREYILHVPVNLSQNAPVVFVLHGYRGNAHAYQNWFKMDPIADANGFVVVYPQGTIDASGNAHWNAGLTNSTMDDKDFLAGLAVSLQSQYNLDASRTFTCGISNGGFMCYYLISERPDIFKAAASISGTMSGTNWQNRNNITVPRPVLQIHGVLDTVVPIDGSMDTAGGWGGASDMNAVIDFWSNLNGCTSSDTIQVNTHTIAYKHKNGIKGNEVWYYLIDNIGHSTPTGGNGTINSSALIGEFFSKY